MSSPKASEGEQPVLLESSHALGYVNKIKDRCAVSTYNQFLDTLQAYRYEAKPVQQVYEQVARIFASAPDLLRQFERFVPKTAAAAARVRAQKSDAMGKLDAAEESETGTTSGQEDGSWEIVDVEEGSVDGWEIVGGFMVRTR